MDRLKSIKSTIDGVLFLQGVFKTDCKRIEEMFQDKLMSENKAPVEMTNYDKIPTYFTTLSEWTKTTNLACWYCNRTFKTRPWFEPQSIEPLNDSSEKKNDTSENAVIIAVHGVFCSCNCVRAYINLHTSSLSDRLNKIAMLKYVYEIFNGKSIPDIQPSPPPTEMLMYGGSLSSTQYQQKIDHLDVAYMKELEDNNFASICNIYINTIIGNQ